jgi:hypothetical protein
MAEEADDAPGGVWRVPVGGDDLMTRPRAPGIALSPLADMCLLET